MSASREYSEGNHDATKSEDKPTLIPFPAANDDYRYLRTRTTIICAVSNAQPIDVAEIESARAWHE